MHAQPLAPADFDFMADYASPFPFTGTLREVTVDVSGDLIHDSESEMRMAMARQ